MVSSWIDTPSPRTGEMLYKVNHKVSQNMKNCAKVTVANYTVSQKKFPPLNSL